MAFLKLYTVGKFTYISIYILIFLEYKWVQCSDLQYLLVCSLVKITPRR